MAPNVLIMMISCFCSPDLSPFVGYSREALYDAGSSQYIGVYAEEAATLDVIDKASRYVA